MRCEDTSVVAADYLAGTLPDERMEDMRVHLASCEACRAELADLHETWQMLDAVREARPDSAAMRVRFEAVLDGYREALAETGTRITFADRVARWWSPRLVFQCVAAAAVLVVGVAIGRMNQAAPPSNDQQLAALRQELGDMRQMVTMSLLTQQSAAERLEGVAWTGRIERPSAEIVSALLDTLMHDSNVNVRLATIDALKRFADQDVVRRATMEALPQQSSPLVQIALIDFVLETSGPDAAPVLRRISEDERVLDAVRMRAARGLEQLGARS